MERQKSTVWIRCIRKIGLPLFVGLYLCSYGLLSYLGSYVRTQSGVLRWTHSGLAITDAAQWQPKFVFWQRFQRFDGTSIVRANPFGYLYAPLVSLDQKLIHPTQRLFTRSSNNSRDANDMDTVVKSVPEDEKSDDP